jgi:isoleucyl-tRNA synthetase
MQDFKQIEEDILKFWDKNNIYEKSKKKNEKGKKFYFLQGPPYTSGKIHIGHAWNNALKDIAMRYKRLNGFNVWDRAGYDMHGLPTENAVQKKLKLKTKEEIIEKGMDKFVKECMNFSLTHAKFMNDDLKRFGIWMDFDNAYMPIKKEFISGQWAFFKKADEQKRLYKGTKVMHWDSQTETSLAKHELEYKTVKDTSIFLKFRKKGTKNEYFIIWTTTPWTIPFNLAIMVNPDVDYVKMEVKTDNGKEHWTVAGVLAGIFMNSVMGEKFKVIEECKGEKLEGQEYEHFLEEELVGKYQELKKQYPKVHSIILSKQYVDTTSGTGLVHCAPGCGPEDEEVARGYGIGGYNSLNEQGELTDGKFKGWTAKVDDEKFIEYFKEKGHLLATTEVEHEYPHSWRSHKPVVFRTTEQWFLKTKDLIPKILNYSNDVNWVPKKSGESYDRWAENLRDNSVTRQRFWGCPVPVWINEKDKNDYIVIGSVEELEKLSGKTFDDLSIHKPWIDEIIIQKDDKTYKRIPDVADVWIDSGTASWNCLDNNPKLIKEFFPADLVLEATEQTRLWFSLLDICSSIMFDKGCFKNSYVHGMILDFEGTKMSKSIGNIISPYEVVDKYSSEIFRYYLCELTPGENISFNWEDIKQKQRNLLVLTNIGNYIKDMLRDTKPLKSIDTRNAEIEEKYIISRLSSTIKKTTDLFEKYQLDQTITEIEKLFLDLSRVYIKITRDKANNSETKAIVLTTLLEVYKKILQMFSTICPLLTEHLWQELKNQCVVKEESIHLANWPEADKKLIDQKTEQEFELGLEIIEKGLAERDKEQIGLKWPLKRATITTDEDIGDNLLAIILMQLNIKEVEFIKPKKPKDKENKENPATELKIELDTKLTPELESEGYAREISRKVQAARKKAGLIKQDKIKLNLQTSKKLDLLLENQITFIKERVNATEITFEEEGKEHEHSVEDKIKKEEIKISFEKI